MRVVVQRSLESSVMVEGNIVGKINKGMVIFIGFTYGDTVKEVDYMIKKITNLRIFDDENGVMNKSLLEVSGDVLSISQFTLYADSKKGNRPSYVRALKSSEAFKLYDLFNERLNKYVHVETGIFGGDMKVNICNDGPVSILLEKEGIV